MMELRELKMALCLPECVFPVALLHGKLSWAAQGNGNTTSLQSTTWVTESSLSPRKAKCSLRPCSVFQPTTTPSISTRR